MASVAVRKAFPALALGLLTGAVLYATSFGTLPQADLTFNNATEIKTVDPAKATGEPEGRVIEGLFEGLLRRMPDPSSQPGTHRVNTIYSPQLAAADHLTISDDGKTYTFHIRPGARWSDSSRLTAQDFAWSWLRMLHPETLSEYSYQLHYIVGAKKFNEATVAVGDAVEVELADRIRSTQTFPRGTILRGKLQEIIEPNALYDKRQVAARTIYVVEIAGGMHRFCRRPQELSSAAGERLEAMQQILPDFDATVGIKAVDDQTLVVTLNNRTAYFSDLVAFYPLYPTNRACVERYGEPGFTKAEHLVSNGPFKIQFRRIRDRVRLEKNEHYWNAEGVTLQTVDAMAVSSDIAALNMYETGQLDWNTNVPPTVIPELLQRDDFHMAPTLSVYFYRVNCTHEPMNNRDVRQALNLAIDKAKICKNILRAGEVPATTFVPPGLAGYEPRQGAPFDAGAARRLLAKAGYPEGHNFPKIEILYNTHETHQAVAEVIQDDWKRNLGINVELRGLEWGSYLESQHKLQYQVSRAGWNADYADPNTFLDMFVTEGANNQTGWSNAEYDRLIAAAASESDPRQRMTLLQQAELILLEQSPILPIAFSMSKDLVRPYVTGFSSNALKVHPLHLLHVDQTQRRQFLRPDVLRQQGQSP